MTTYGNKKRFTVYSKQFSVKWAKRDDITTHSPCFAIHDSALTRRSCRYWAASWSFLEPAIWEAPPLPSASLLNPFCALQMPHPAQTPELRGLGQLRCSWQRHHRVPACGLTSGNPEGGANYSQTCLVEIFIKILKRDSPFPVLREFTTCCSAGWHLW